MAAEMTAFWSGKSPDFTSHTAKVMLVETLPDSRTALTPFLATAETFSLNASALAAVRARGRTISFASSNVGTCAALVSVFSTTQTALSDATTP